MSQVPSYLRSQSDLVKWSHVFNLVSSKYSSLKDGTLKILKSNTENVWIWPITRLGRTKPYGFGQTKQACKKPQRQSKFFLTRLFCSQRPKIFCHFATEICYPLRWQTEYVWKKNHTSVTRPIDYQSNHFDFGLNPPHA